MDLDLLRTFLEVNRTRHFGRAAASLHITQAAVSTRIKHLESLLGVRLFDRIRRNIRPTPEGHRLIQHADMILANWRKAMQEVGARGKRQVTIGGSQRLWEVLLQDWLHRVRSNEPDLAITAESFSAQVLTQKLFDGVLDVAFMLEPAQMELLHITRIADIELRMVSTHRGITAQQAITSDFVMVDWGVTQALEQARHFPNAPEPQTRVAQAGTALNYLMALGGSAYLPGGMADTTGGKGHKLYPVANAPVFHCQAYAVYPLRSAKMELIHSLMRYFAE